MLGIFICFALLGGDRMTEGTSGSALRIASDRSWSVPNCVPGRWHGIDSVVVQDSVLQVEPKIKVPPWL